MSIKPWLRIASAFALALGFMGCVTEDDEPLPLGAGEPVEPDGPPPAGEIPEDFIPTDEDDTCGRAQLKADGTCAPK